MAIFEGWREGKEASQASRLPSFSAGPKSIGKDREFGEHRGEPFDQRQKSHFRHCGDRFVEHAAPAMADFG
jgi:hypothetical protein